MITPILGEALLDLLKGLKGEEALGGIDAFPMIVSIASFFKSDPPLALFLTFEDYHQRLA